MLTADNPQDAATIAATITRLLPESRPILRDEILDTYGKYLGWRGGLVSVVFWGAMLAFIILMSDKATGAGAEQTREAGILKALGWKTFDIVLMRFWEGIIVSLSAFFLGVLLAHLHVYFGSSMIFKIVLKDGRCPIRNSNSPPSFGCSMWLSSFSSQSFPTYSSR